MADSAYGHLKLSSALLKDLERYTAGRQTAGGGVRKRPPPPPPTVKAASPRGGSSRNLTTTKHAASPPSAGRQLPPSREKSPTDCERQRQRGNQRSGSVSSSQGGGGGGGGTNSPNSRRLSMMFEASLLERRASQQQQQHSAHSLSASARLAETGNSGGRSLSIASTAADITAAVSATAVAAAAQTMRVSRFDLLLEDDLPRLLDAYCAVDEGLCGALAAPSEVREVCQLAGVRFDPGMVSRSLQLQQHHRSLRAKHGGSAADDAAGMVSGSSAYMPASQQRSHQEAFHQQHHHQQQQQQQRVPFFELMCTMFPSTSTRAVANAIRGLLAPSFIAALMPQHTTLQSPPRGFPTGGNRRGGASEGAAAADAEETGIAPAPPPWIQWLVRDCQAATTPSEARLVEGIRLSADAAAAAATKEETREGPRASQRPNADDGGGFVTFMEDDDDDTVSIAEESNTNLEGSHRGQPPKTLGSLLRSGKTSFRRPNTAPPTRPANDTSPSPTAAPSKNASFAGNSTAASVSSSDADSRRREALALMAARGHPQSSQGAGSNMQLSLVSNAGSTAPATNSSASLLYDYADPYDVPKVHFNALWRVLCLDERRRRAAMALIALEEERDEALVEKYLLPLCLMLQKGQRPQMRHTDGFVGVSGTQHVPVFSGGGGGGTSATHRSDAYPVVPALLLGGSGAAFMDSFVSSSPLPSPAGGASSPPRSGRGPTEAPTATAAPATALGATPPRSFGASLRSDTKSPLVSVVQTPPRRVKDADSPASPIHRGGDGDVSPQPAALMMASPVLALAPRGGRAQQMPLSSVSASPIASLTRSAVGSASAKQILRPSPAAATDAYASPEPAAVTATDLFTSNKTTAVVSKLTFTAEDVAFYFPSRVIAPTVTACSDPFFAADGGKRETNVASNSNPYAMQRTGPGRIGEATLVALATKASTEMYARRRADREAFRHLRLRDVLRHCKIPPPVVSQLLAVREPTFLCLRTLVLRWEQMLPAIAAAVRAAVADPLVCRVPLPDGPLSTAATPSANTHAAGASGRAPVSNGFSQQALERGTLRGRPQSAKSNLSSEGAAPMRRIPTASPDALLGPSSMLMRSNRHTSAAAKQQPQYCPSSTSSSDDEEDVVTVADGTSRPLLWSPNATRRGEEAETEAAAGASTGPFGPQQQPSPFSPRPPPLSAPAHSRSTNVEAAGASLAFGNASVGSQQQSASGSANSMITALRNAAGASGTTGYVTSVALLESLCLGRLAAIVACCRRFGAMAVMRQRWDPTLAEGPWPGEDSVALQSQAAIPNPNDRDDSGEPHSASLSFSAPQQWQRHPMMKGSDSNCDPFSSAVFGSTVLSAPPSGAFRSHESSAINALSSASLSSPRPHAPPLSWRPPIDVASLVFSARQLTEMFTTGDSLSAQLIRDQQQRGAGGGGGSALSSNPDLHPAAVSRCRPPLPPSAFTPAEVAASLKAAAIASASGDGVVPYAAFGLVEGSKRPPRPDDDNTGARLTLSSAAAAEGNPYRLGSVESDSPTAPRLRLVLPHPLSAAEAALFRPAHTGGTKASTCSTFSDSDDDEADVISSSNANIDEASRILATAVGDTEEEEGAHHLTADGAIEANQATTACKYSASGSDWGSFFLTSIQNILKVGPDGREMLSPQGIDASSTTITQDASHLPAAVVSTGVGRAAAPSPPPSAKPPSAARARQCPPHSFTDAEKQQRRIIDIVTRATPLNFIPHSEYLRAYGVAGAGGHMRIVEANSSSGGGGRGRGLGSRDATVLAPVDTPSVYMHRHGDEVAVGSSDESAAEDLPTTLTKKRSFAESVGMREGDLHRMLRARPPSSAHANRRLSAGLSNRHRGDGEVSGARSARTGGSGGPPLLVRSTTEDLRPRSASSATLSVTAPTYVQQQQQRRGQVSSTSGRNQFSLQPSAALATAIADTILVPPREAERAFAAANSEARAGALWSRASMVDAPRYTTARTPFNGLEAPYPRVACGSSDEDSGDDEGESEGFAIV